MKKEEWEERDLTDRRPKRRYNVLKHNLVLFFADQNYRIGMVACGDDRNFVIELGGAVQDLNSDGINNGYVKAWAYNEIDNLWHIPGNDEITIRDVLSMSAVFVHEETSRSPDTILLST